MNKYILYEAGKQQIANIAKSSHEYERMIRELARKLKV